MVSLMCLKKIPYTELYSLCFPNSINHVCCLFNDGGSLGVCHHRRGCLEAALILGAIELVL